MKRASQTLHREGTALWMTTETRARVWDEPNQTWLPKCPNFTVCRQGIWPTCDECVQCETGIGVPSRCTAVAACAYCASASRLRSAHAAPCGHKIGVKCAREYLFPDSPTPEPTYQDFGCPPTAHLDDDAAEQMELEWCDRVIDPLSDPRMNDPRIRIDPREPLTNRQWANLVWDRWDDEQGAHRQSMRKRLSKCPLCRASTGAVIDT